MLSWKSESVNVRYGLVKCWSCGELYDPTYGKCPCKRKRKPNNFYVSTFALIIVVFLSAMYIKDAGAQAEPIEPTPVCFWIDEGLVCINHIAMTPQPTPMPTLTPAPTITPLPQRNDVYLSLVLR
jgi:hypothetical protein